MKCTCGANKDDCVDCMKDRYNALAKLARCLLKEVDDFMVGTWNSNIDEVIDELEEFLAKDKS